MNPIAISSTIQALPKAGFLAYITYQLHKLLAHWPLILGFGALLSIVIFFLIPLAKNSTALTPEWRAIVLISFLGSLVLTTKLCHVAQKRLFVEDVSNAPLAKTAHTPRGRQEVQKIQHLIIEGDVEAFQTLFEEGKIDLKAVASPKDWAILHLLTISACQHTGFLSLLNQVLEQERVPLNLKSINGFTPLHLAAYLGNKRLGAH